MKVRMLVGMAGVGVSHQPGDIVEVSKEVASAWRDAGIAVQVSEEKAERKTPEKAIKRSNQNK